MKQKIWIVGVGVAVGSLLAAHLATAQGRGGPPPNPAQSPASVRPPQTVTPQTYPAEQVRRGEARFAAQCASCHGRDAGGDAPGTDLTRSRLVAEDVRGDKLAPMLLAGRIDKGMPAFTLNEGDLAAIVAFVHDRKTNAESLAGGRRSVDTRDLQIGDAEAGRKYFTGTGKCSTCHSTTGDLAGIGSRLQGLALMQRMLNPTGQRKMPAKVVVTEPSGATVSGTLVSRDEFTLVMTDASGMRRTWSLAEVKAAVDDPLSAHFEQLGKYTDKDMHDVLVYLQTLR